MLALESRYLDKPIRPAMLNEASENETAIVGVGTLPQRKGKENENREVIVLLRCTVCQFVELLQAVRTITW